MIALVQLLIIQAATGVTPSANRAPRRSSACSTISSAVPTAPVATRRTVLTGTLATDAAGTAFLKEKAAEAGVTATGSGLLYKVIKSADSPAKSPLVSTPTVCHYKGTLIDGTE